MKLIDIIPFLQKNASSIKIHCAIGRINKLEPLFKFSSGEFKQWQDGQNNKNFERDYILSIIYMSKGEWLFAGVYKKISVKETADGKYIYQTELLNVGIDVIGRLIISFNKDFRASYLLLENYLDDLFLSEIKKNAYKIEPFPGFESIKISFALLKEVFNENEKTWESALSNVKGVYLISDVLTGKLYVGSAYGEYAFWQRWNEYIKTGHGGNKKLKELIINYGFEYAYNFQFTILEIRNMNIEDEIIIQRESFWKDCLLTRQFGNNDN